MHKLILTAGLFTCVMVIGAVPKKPAPKKPAPMATVQERKLWLKKCNDFLKKTDDTISDSNDLFIYEAVNSEKIELITQVVAKEEPKVVPNELAILQKVGEAIKPEGRVMVNGQFALCLNGSRLVTTKTVLNAKSGAQTYRITVKNINKNQFTLQLNQNTLTFNY